jgi:Ca2+-binding RTX toxin-like protein
MGRGGDSASSGGGTDTFVFKEAPWASGHIAGFAGQDVLDLQFLQTYGYTGSNPIADGRIKVTPDGAGGAQVWVVLDGLGGAAGTWLVTTLDGVSPSSLAWQSGRLVDPPASSGSTSMSPPSPGPQPALTGVTFTSDNNGDHWTGTSSNDFFNLGRGGDTVTGNGGADTFRFAETPWAGGHITDFGPDDVLDLSPMMARYGYAGSDPGGRITIAPDGAGGAQVWFNMGGLAGASGNWLVTTLDHVSPSSVQVSNGLIRTGAAAAGASTSGAAAAGQTFTSDNSGDHWTGSTGPDTFYVGRGGDVLTGAGGDDTFVFREAPWARAQITDFHAGDQIDLSSMLARYGYQGSDPIGDGHMKIVSDGAGGAQIWFDFDGLPSASGTWQLATLDHFAPSQLHVSGAYITG